ncbi:MAG: CRTAC1 family protein [Myxococcota bacterium]
MDLVIENVGRRSNTWGGEGDPTDVGEASLNGRERNALYWNRGDGSFEEVGHLTHAGRIEDGRGVAVADFDRDGRLDLAIQNLDKPAVLLMGKGETGNWLQVRLEGTRSNRDAIGAEVVVETDGRRQLRQVSAGAGFLSSSSRVLHFGLGAVETIERLEVRWPSGERQVVEALDANQQILLREGDARATAAR